MLGVLSLGLVSVICWNHCECDMEGYGWMWWRFVWCWHVAGEIATVRGDHVRNMGRVVQRDRGY
jgi:hypothetical protein